MAERRAAVEWSVTGPAGLADAPRLREEALRAMAAPGDLRIDLEGSGPWDFAGFQILLSALATAAGEGRTVALSGVPDTLRAMANAAGVEL